MFENTLKTTSSNECGDYVFCNRVLKQRSLGNKIRNDKSQILLWGLPAVVTCSFRKASDFASRQRSTGARFGGQNRSHSDRNILDHMLRIGIAQNLTQLGTVQANQS